MAISIGCGSWADPEYVGVLYPSGLPAKARLSGYAKRFDHVEVNASYYAIPKPEVLAGWAQQTPPHFIFDLKLHRVFAQKPERAAREGDLLARTLAAAETLQSRFGVFLLVLPPSFTPDRHALAELDAVVAGLAPHTLAVELRHADWVNEKNRATTLAYFRARRIAWVAVDMPRIAGSSLMPPLDLVTHPELAYLRLHGRNPHYLEAKSAEEGHTYEYTAKELDEIVDRVHRLAAEAKNVRVVANNHAQDYAPKTALEIKRRLGQLQK